MQFLMNENNCLPAGCTTLGEIAAQQAHSRYVDAKLPGALGHVMEGAHFFHLQGAFTAIFGEIVHLKGFARGPFASAGNLLRSQRVCIL